MTLETTAKKEKISIVCPVFNEEEAIPLFYQRLKTVLATIPRFQYELIFTNNRSTDKSLVRIQELQKTDSNVHVLTFSRNFGYQASISAGIRYASGDAVIIIDVDCEDPPEMIPLFVQKWLEGHDIAYGIRGRRQEARIITACRLLFYRILKATADTDIILDMAEFSLMSAHVRDTILKNSNTFPFLRAEIAYSGFKKVGIPYDREQRIIGMSKYNLWRMALFAIAGILSVSTFPLRLSVYLMPLVGLLNLVGVILDYANILPCFKGLVIFDLFYLMGLVTSQGLYIARIYKNGIGRPLYIVDWELSDISLHSRGASA
jgi:glycosyltransferase involved in cell wall biosynthesis